MEYGSDYGRSQPLYDTRRSGGPGATPLVRATGFFDPARRKPVWAFSGASGTR